MQETTQHLTLVTPILSETSGPDTKPSKHSKQGRIRKCLKPTPHRKLSDGIVIF